MAFSDLDMDDIVGVYWRGRRWRGWGQEVKGQGYCSRRCGVLSNLLQVLTLFSSREGEEDLDKGGMEDAGGELLQVAVEGVGDEEVQDQSRQQGEGDVKGQAK